MFGVGIDGVVALLADLPAHGVPHLVQVRQRRAEHSLGIAPDLQFALACVDFRRDRACLAHKVAELGQAVLAQRLHHVITLGGAHLQQHTQLFVEQGLQGEFFSAGTDLARPIFGVARVHAAVAHAIAFGH